MIIVIDTSKEKEEAEKEEEEAEKEESRRRAYEACAWKVRFGFVYPPFTPPTFFRPVTEYDLR